jgi:iron complex outermembrane recepter protein
VADKLDWLLGAFYTHEASQYFENVFAADPTTGAIVGQFAHYSAPATYEEYAAYADLTVHITSQFDVQVGGRESEIKETFSAIQTGPLDEAFGLPSPYIIPEEESRNSAFTYLVTPRFRFSSDLMVYARLASGYRPGGPNASVPGLPQKYDPDKTFNYEIGTKADFWDHRLSVDTSIYYIDWKDIQIFLENPLTGQGYTANGSRAKSQGLELSAELKPLRGMKITGWVAWDDAELTAALPADTTAAAGPGDRLPYSSRFSANASLEQSFPLGSHLTGFGGVAASYVGDRQGEFASIYASTPARQDLPAYTKLDLRAGARYDTWRLDLYANNVTDRRGLLSGGLGTSPPFAFILLQPRTVGFNVSEKF